MFNRCVVVLIVVGSALNCCSGRAKSTPNIAIIGSGPTGLLAAKYAIKQCLNVTVYEQNEVVGGVWWYTDEIGKNKYGVPIHTSMYKGLRYIHVSTSFQKVHKNSKNDDLGPMSQSD